MSEPADHHQDVLVTADQEVMIITINRPPAKNAMRSSEAWSRQPEA